MAHPIHAHELPRFERNVKPWHGLDTTEYDRIHAQFLQLGILNDEDMEAHIAMAIIAGRPAGDKLK